MFTKFTNPSTLGTYFVNFNFITNSTYKIN